MTENGFTSPEKPLEAIGINYAGLSEEERAMKNLLSEELKKREESFITEVKKWRADNPTSTLGDAIRALYYEIEEKS